MTRGTPIGLLEYLEGLSAATLDRLYMDTCSAVVVYRLLPELAQYTIRRLLLASGPTPFESVRSYHYASFRIQQNPILLKLKHLQILQGRAGEVWLNEEFRQSLLRAFSGDLEVSISGVPNAELEGQANDHWEALLYMLVTGNRDKTLTSVKLTHFLDVLVGAGLAGKSLEITNAGFQFLLEGRTTQLWMLFVQYFGMAEATGLDVVFCVSAVCRVALTPVGVVTRGEGVPPVVAEFLCELGLWRQVGGTMNEFVVTPLTRYLLSAPSREQAAGYIVIETNYKVYAYTTSALQIAILGLFVRLRDRFANMAHGQLTGPSVSAALEKGITAAQLITFLHSHLHPVMRRTDPALPAVIEDQIHLWESDRRRLRNAEGFLYQQFLDEASFNRAVTEATRLSATLYVNYQKRLLIIKPEAHSALKAFIKAEQQP